MSFPCKKQFSGISIQNPKESISLLAKDMRDFCQEKKKEKTTNQNQTKKNPTQIFQFGHKSELIWSSEILQKICGVSGQARKSQNIF